MSHERQHTRINSVRDYLDREIQATGDLQTMRNGYVHLYGVGQACAMIALHRGHDRAYAELAEIAGMLHDYVTYTGECMGEEHARLSSIAVRKVLTELNEFTAEEIELVCDAINRHSDKDRIDTPFDEILKDADTLQHWLRNPVEEYFYQQERIPLLMEEFGLTKD